MQVLFQPSFEAVFLGSEEREIYNARKTNQQKNQNKTKSSQAAPLENRKPWGLAALPSQKLLNCTVLHLFYSVTSKGKVQWLTFKGRVWCWRQCARSERSRFKSLGQCNLDLVFSNSSVSTLNTRLLNKNMWTMLFSFPIFSGLMLRYLCMELCFCLAEMSLLFEITGYMDAFVAMLHKSRINSKLW